MHICHVIGRLKGGPATSVRYLVLRQLAAGHQVTCVFGAKHETEADVRKYIPEPARLIPFTVDRAISLVEDGRAIVQLTRILRDVAPDVVHLHSSKAGALGRLSCRYLGLPNVYSPRAVSYLRRDLGIFARASLTLIETVLALLGGPVVACSKGEYAALRRLPCSVTLIPNQVDADEIDRLTGHRPAPDGPFRVVICGRIEPQKNPAMIARLIAAAPAEWEWVWAGGGSCEAVVQNLPGLHITGWIDHPEALRQIHNGHVLLHATAWEGMPNAILEAMVMGRPVVTTNIEGNRDLVRHGQTGFVCDTEDAILPALHRLANDRSFARALGETGRAMAIADHHPDRVMPQWTSLYARLVRG